MNFNLNNKRTWLGAMFSFALIAIMGLTFAFKPFNTKVIEKKSKTVAWQFTGSSTADILDPSKYSQSAIPNPDCGNGTDLPCQVNFPAGTISETDVENYLDTHNESQVLAISSDKRKLP